MSRNFFDDLTDPRTPPPRALDAASRDLQQRLQPALSLLQRAAPENGIDLVPRWERFLEQELRAQEQESQPPHKLVAAKADQAPRRSRWPSPALRYAAVLLLGLGLGTVMNGANTFRSTSTLDRGQCDYTPSQRQAMFEVLQEAEAGSLNSVRLASLDLAGCLGCHETALGRAYGSDLRGVLGRP